MVTQGEEKGGSRKSTECDEWEFVQGFLSAFRQVLLPGFLQDCTRNSFIDFSQYSFGESFKNVSWVSIRDSS